MHCTRNKIFEEKKYFEDINSYQEMTEDDDISTLKRSKIFKRTQFSLVIIDLFIVQYYKADEMQSDMGVLVACCTELQTMKISTVINKCPKMMISAR